MNFTLSSPASKAGGSTASRKSLDEVKSDAVYQNLIRILESDPVFKESLVKLEANPEQMFFKIGDAASVVGVKTYILRYWESEFKKFLRPLKTRSQQRIYRKKDVLYALLIQNLVYEKGFTVDGARKKIQELVGTAEVSWKESIAPTVMDEVLKKLVGLEHKVQAYDFYGVLEDSGSESTEVMLQA
jgi:DNA-binding transcriptional MerR regulator